MSIDDSNPPDRPILEQFDGPFFREIANRKQQGRDAKILITAKDGQTGVGKSNLSDFLGYVLDTSESGFGPEKVTIEPEMFLSMYTELEEGSAAIMEEGEQFDARRSQSNKNVDAAEKWQMARVREIVSIINLPSPAEIDSRFERLADYWINVEIRGRATVYKKRIHPTKGKIYHEKLQQLEWPNMDGSATFRRMATIKDSLLDDDTRDANWVRESEVKERVKKARREAKEDLRDQWLLALYDELPRIAGVEVTYDQLARLSVAGVGAERIGQIVRRVRDEE
jgi:hypothetical protein